MLFVEILLLQRSFKKILEMYDIFFSMFYYLLAFVVSCLDFVCLLCLNIFASYDAGVYLRFTPIYYILFAHFVHSFFFFFF